MGRPDPSRGRPGIPHSRVSRFPALAMAGMLLVVAACASGGDDPEATTSGSATPATTGPTLAALSGTWVNDLLVLEVNDGGEFVIHPAGDPAGPAIGGFIARDGDQFSFVTSIEGECPGQTGVYQVLAAGDTLSLLLVEDQCDVRSSGFAEPFGRSEPSG